MMSNYSKPILFVLNGLFHLISQIIHILQDACSKLLQTEGNNFTGLSSVPGPKPIPIFGTTLAPETKFTNIIQNTEYLLKKYGSIIKVELMWNFRLILVYDINDIQIVLKNSILTRPPVEIVQMYRETRKDRYFTCGIVNIPAGEEWERFRVLLLKTIQCPKYFSDSYHKCNQIADEFNNVIRGYENGQIKHLEDLVLRYVTEGVFASVVGKRMGFLELGVPNKMEEFIYVQANYFKVLHTSFYGFPWWKYVPHRVWDELAECEDRTYDIFSKLVENERRSGPQGLLKLILESDEIHELDKIVLAMDMVMGAMETSQNTILMILGLCVTAPNVQDRIYEELRRILPNKDSPITEDIMRQLPYFKGCIQEGFRLLPTAPNLARLIGQDIVLQGYTIPAYTLCVCQHWHANLQDSNYYQAKEFIPERWFECPEGQVRSKEILPHRSKLYHFGTGRRDCPGRPFATLEIQMLLAKIFRNFKIELDAPMKIKFEFIQAPVTPIKARVTERLD